MLQEAVACSVRPRGCPTLRGAAESPGLPRPMRTTDLPGIAGSHVHRVLPGASVYSACKAPGGAVSHQRVPSAGCSRGVREAPQVSATGVL